MVKRHHSKPNWLAEHFTDEYVKKAHLTGARSRAGFKLEQIQYRDRLLKPGMTVIDLGAAPGAWSAYVRDKIGHQGKVIAVDILPMDQLAGVECIQGDFSDAATYAALKAALLGEAADLVLSDMTPNMSGISAIDQPRIYALAECALDAACELLKPGGHFLVKVFQGTGFEDFLMLMRSHFEKVATRKPKASRARSKEVYLLGSRLQKSS